MFGMGLAVLGRIIGQSDEMSNELDKETHARMMNMEMTGKVAIYPETFTLKREKTKVFAFGIKNVGNLADFKVEIELSSQPTDNSPKLTARDFTFVENGFFKDETYSIEKNDREVISMPIRIPNTAAKGRYIFAIKAFKDGSTDSYAPTKIIYVDVD